jgi:hypothetical protein
MTGRTYDKTRTALLFVDTDNAALPPSRARRRMAATDGAGPVIGGTPSTER